MKQWKTDNIVPSLVHGAAAKESWVAAVNDVMSLFVTNRNVSSAQEMLAQACIDAGVCK